MILIHESHVFQLLVETKFWGVWSLHFFLTLYLWSKEEDLTNVGLNGIWTLAWHLIASTKPIPFVSALWVWLCMIHRTFSQMLPKWCWNVPNNLEQRDKSFFFNFILLWLFLFLVLFFLFLRPVYLCAHYVQYVIEITGTAVSTYILYKTAAS